MAKFDLPSLRMRIISALVLAPLVIFIIAHGGLPFLLFVLGCAAVSLWEWFFLAQKVKQKILYGVLGFAYIGISYACCYLIREQYTAGIALLFILMVWSSDIGAFFAGKTFGGPKMASTISPNKTWSGFAGAAVFPALAGLVWVAASQYIGGLGLAALSYFLVVAAAGLLTGVAGQSGDLLVSFVKRRAGVKDSGNIIPGHGGLLDRVDAMMMAAPPFLLFAKVLFDAG